MRVLDGLLAEHGRPGMIVSDNGTEFTCNAILKWAEDNGVEWHYIAPGKPQQNGYMESFQRQAARRMPERARVRIALRGRGVSSNPGASITMTSAHIRASAI